MLGEENGKDSKNVCSYSNWLSERIRNFIIFVYYGTFCNECSLPYIKGNA